MLNLKAVKTTSNYFIACSLNAVTWQQQCLSNSVQRSCLGGHVIPLPLSQSPWQRLAAARHLWSLMWNCILALQAGTRITYSIGGWWHSLISYGIKWCHLPILYGIRWCHSLISYGIKWCHSPISYGIRWCHSQISYDIGRCHSPTLRGIRWCHSPISALGDVTNAIRH